MNVKIRALNFEITPEITDMIEERFVSKIEILLPHFAPDMKIANFSLEKDKYGTFITKFDISLPGKGGNIFSENKHIDLVGAVTGLREQVEKQIEKYKAELSSYGA